MDLMNARDPLETARNVHDLSSLNRLREAAFADDDNALKEAAQQFEAIFVQMMLKSMRKAQEALADEDSPFNSDQVKFYRDMHDKQLANDLSSNGGVGLADIIVQQLAQHDVANYIPAEIGRNDGDLASLNLRRQQQTVDAQNSAQLLSDPANRQAVKAALFASPQAFVESLYPLAKDAAAELGVAPEALVAQAAVETGWGQHVIHDSQGVSSNNLFGIKANSQWDGEANTVETLEFNGTVAAKQKASFRAYDSLASGFSDYVSFVRDQSRYAEAVNKAQDSQAYFESLQKAGYATDPEYANKVMAVLNSNAFQSYLP